MRGRTLVLAAALLAGACASMSGYSPGGDGPAPAASVDPETAPLPPMPRPSMLDPRAPIDGGR